MARSSTKLADCFVNEYGGFSPVPGVELNGKLTLGENTADNGGIRLAYLALMDDLAQKAVPASTEGQTATPQPQQFFLGFRAGVVRKRAPGTGAPVGADGSPFAGQISRERRSLEHAGVQPGLRLQSRRQDVRGARLAASGRTDTNP